MNRSILIKNKNKEDLFAIKNDSRFFNSFIEKENDGNIIYALEKLGRLEDDYIKKPLINLLNNKNEIIRKLAIKNLAKICDISLLEVFIRFAEEDESTEVRRESVSAIGRLRNEKTLKILIKFLEDKDPKIVMQAIRGLLVFSDNLSVRQELKKLINHPNELIKEVVLKEINGSSYSSSTNENHDDYPQFLKNIIVHGDVVETIKKIPNESIHLTFTSPPYYNARDYSIYQSYEEYLFFLEKVFSEVHRVTKEGRFFVLNTSPVIIPRISRSHSSKRYPIPYDIHPILVKMGWEFIDDIVWSKPEASVKNRNAGFLQHRKPLGYKPNAVTEMIMVYRKKTDKLIDWNIKQYGLDKVKKSKILDKYETTNIWQISPAFDKVHSAVFPIELCNRVIRYYSFVDDLIFDPFAGSGTLGLASLNLERNFLLAEKEHKYIERMKENFAKYKNLFNSKNKLPDFISFENFKNISKKYENN